MNCSVCEFPKRRIWPPLVRLPELQNLSSKNWMSLSECSSCKTLWACVPYEPYASFPYYVAWDKTELEWQKEISENNGLYLQEWHKQELLKYKSTLTNEDIVAIKKHRSRSSGRDPYNET